MQIGYIRTAKYNPIYYVFYNIFAYIYIATEYEILFSLLYNSPHIFTSNIKKQEISVCVRTQVGKSEKALTHAT